MVDRLLGWPPQSLPPDVYVFYSSLPLEVGRTWVLLLANRIMEKVMGYTCLRVHDHMITHNAVAPYLLESLSPLALSHAGKPH